MEGAVRSGYIAAQALLVQAERPRDLLFPDLTPSGLMKIL